MAWAQTLIEFQWYWSGIGWCRQGYVFIVEAFLVRSVLIWSIILYSGYKTIITLPEKMSAEKVAVLRALNATIIRTPNEAAFDSPESHIGVARRLEKELPNAHILDQYENPNNPLAHELGTAEEIWTQTNGKISAIVAGAGTGGTITGLARGLRKHNPDINVIAADPFGSILALPPSLNEARANEPYKVEGIGYDFIPEVLDQDVVTQWIKTEDKESFKYSRRLIAEEGLLVGGSSGSAIAALVKANEAKKFSKDDVAVVILPDSIRSYLSKVGSNFFSPPIHFAIKLTDSSSPMTTGSQPTICSHRFPPLHRQLKPRHPRLTLWPMPRLAPCA